MKDCLTVVCDEDVRSDTKYPEKLAHHLVQKKFSLSGREDQY